MTDPRTVILELTEARCDEFERLLHTWTEALYAAGDIEGAAMVAQRVYGRFLDLAYRAETRKRALSSLLTEPQGRPGETPSPG